MFNKLIPFVTGSSIYGKYYTEKSDIDLVVYMTHKDLRTLREAAGKEDDWFSEYRGFAPDCEPLKFDNLNIIPVITKKQYKLWKKATKVCKKICPTTKKQAIEIFDSIFGGKERN